MAWFVCSKWLERHTHTTLFVDIISSTEHDDHMLQRTQYCYYTPRLLVCHSRARITPPTPPAPNDARVKYENSSAVRSMRPMDDRIFVNPTSWVQIRRNKGSRKGVRPIALTNWGLPRQGWVRYLIEGVRAQPLPWRWWWLSMLPEFLPAVLLRG